VVRSAERGLVDSASAGTSRWTADDARGGWSMSPAQGPLGGSVDDGVRGVVNWNKTALLITSLPLPDNFLHNLNIAAGSKAITCTPINKKTAPNEPKIDNPRKKPQFSVVIKHVDHDIDENDINQVLASLELPIQRLWRIKSRQSNKFTTLIRVITEDTATVDFLLKNGLTLFGKHHQCEPSKPPEPTPLQCTKCYQLGHPATGCTNKPACLKCPETHAPNNCEAATPKCLLCGGRSRPALVTQVPQIERHPSPTRPQ
jgi:hypothetical protein